MTREERKIIADECGKAWLNMAICLKEHRTDYNNFADQCKFIETNERYQRLQSQWFALQILCDKLGIEMSEDYSDKAFKITHTIYCSFQN